MRRLAPIHVLVLAVSCLYLVAALAPCPSARPPATGEPPSGRFHALHHGSDPASEHAVGHHAPCHEPKATLFLDAVCPCGCDSGPEAGGVSLAVGYAVPSRTPRPISPLVGQDLLMEHWELPSATATGFDHVPRSI